MSSDNEARWLPVLTTSGLYEADLLSAELRRVGIPARVVQEPAGAAFGLTTGKMGEVTVEVPAGQVEEAQLFLSQFHQPAGEEPAGETPVEQVDEFEYDPDDGVPIPDEFGDDGPDMFSRISRGALVVAAVAFSPVGVLLALIGTWLSGRRDP